MLEAQGRADASAGTRRPSRAEVSLDQRISVFFTEGLQLTNEAQPQGRGLSAFLSLSTQMLVYLSN